MIEISKCVVDASVGIKLLVKEDLSDVAESLFETMAANPETRQYVPDLFFVECANVLWKYVTRYGYPRKDATRNLSQLYALNLTYIPTPTVTPAALLIAVEHSISVYDACYVAASDLISAPLITADKRLVKRLADTKRQACYLGDLQA